MNDNVCNVECGPWRKSLTVMVTESVYILILHSSKNMRWVSLHIHANASYFLCIIFSLWGIAFPIFFSRKIMMKLSAAVEIGTCFQWDRLEADIDALLLDTVVLFCCFFIFSCSFFFFVTPTGHPLSAFSGSFLSFIVNCTSSYNNNNNKEYI